MNHKDSVPAHRHGAPMMPSTTSLATPSLGVAEICTLVLMSPVLTIVVAAVILDISSCLSRRYGNVLPSLGPGKLAGVFKGTFGTTPNDNWSTILMSAKSKMQEEMARLVEEQQNLKNRVREQLALHLDQSAEIADWDVVPLAILRDRINRRKAVLRMQKRATKIRVRRELYSRALWYSDTLEERKRGQRILCRDLFYGGCIYAYCMLLWIFDMAFASIWTAMTLFELVFVLATEPWGVELRLVITQ
jgi:hypothetical protein